jgi:hypothetical protein
MPAWLRRYLPSWLEQPLEWVLHPIGLALITIASLLFFVLSVVGVPWYLARLPADYFSRRERRELGLPRIRRRPVRWLWFVARNALGFTLIAAGILMLVLPGQGLLTIVAGLFLADFPGKHRLERALIAIGPVYRGINALRHRAGRPPLERG